MEEQQQEEVEAVVEERKPYKRCRLREHYTCIDTQVSLQRSDLVDVLDTRRDPLWLVRHSTDQHKVLVSSMRSNYKPKQSYRRADTRVTF